jgi:hypothetical protein
VSGSTAGRCGAGASPPASRARAEVSWAFSASQRAFQTSSSLPHARTYASVTSSEGKVFPLAAEESAAADRKAFLASCRYGGFPAR